MKLLESSVKAPDRNAQFEEMYAQYADDVFVKLYTRGEAIAPGCEKAWLLRVTVNCCRDLWRSAWLKRVVLGAPTLEIIPAQEDTIEQREEKAELMRAIHKLPVQFRETILLHYYQGLGIAEIAQMLGLPEGTISSRLSRARKKLESLLKDEAAHLIRRTGRKETVRLYAAPCARALLCGAGGRLHRHVRAAAESDGRERGGFACARLD